MVNKMITEEDKKKRKKLLDRLLEVIDIIKLSIKENPGKYFFNEGASVTEILDFEADNNIMLPFFYKVFLNHFNGGFISQISVPDSTQLETASWNSINLFSVSEIHEEYSKLSLQNWKFSDPQTEVYPFIPFGRTAIGELLIFVNPLQKNDECPVFDAFHEEWPSDWGNLYPDFSLFLDAYVKNNGVIKTISYDHPTVMEYLDKVVKED